MKLFLILTALMLCSACQVQAANPPAPQQQPKIGKLPHVEFDAQKRQIRVECEMLGVNAPLEFFCCVKGTNDYESMIRSEVKPSHLHLALLAIGLKPGEPVHYSEAAKKWFPPQGPPLQISVEYEKDGKFISQPAWRWMRDVKTKKSAPPFTWVFTGSREVNGMYAADTTGYLVTVVNFEMSVVDVPELASSSNDLLEWERNPDTTPKAGTKVWMVIEPAGNQSHGSAAHSAPQTPASGPTTRAAVDDVDSQIAAAQANVKALQEQWDRQVAPSRGELRRAAEAHYQIIQQLHAQQQKLIDEADRVQRTIDELEKDYQDLTTPRPPDGK